MARSGATKTSSQLHLRHARSRYSRGRADHSHPAPTGEELARGQCGGSIAHLWAAGLALFPDAISLRASARQLIGPLWAADGYPDLAAWLRVGLFRPGVCAEPGLVLCR